MNDLILKVEQWAEERELDSVTLSDKQLLKFYEEAGELAQGYVKGKHKQVIDSVGDVLVTLIIFCQQQGLLIEDCLAVAYNEISSRKGKIVNGSYIKEEDLKHD